ncbi:hypothetical protein KI387_028236, partial [Taxus chinensis]
SYIVGKVAMEDFEATTRFHFSDLLSEDLSTTSKAKDVQKQPFVIGVAGGTAAGKTTVCNTIISQLRDQRVALLNQDFFHHVLSEEEVKHVWDYNFDHPDSFDTEHLLDCMMMLKQGKSIDIPSYNIKLHQKCEPIRKWTGQEEENPAFTMDEIASFKREAMEGEALAGLRGNIGLDEIFECDLQHAAEEPPTPPSSSKIEPDSQPSRRSMETQPSFKPFTGRRMNRPHVGQAVGLELLMSCSCSGSVKDCSPLCKHSLHAKSGYLLGGRWLKPQPRNMPKSLP